MKLASAPRCPELAHEYPERRAEQAAAVNAIYEQCPSLLITFLDFVSAVESRLSPAGDDPTDQPLLRPSPIACPP